MINEGLSILAFRGLCSRHNKPAQSHNRGGQTGEKDTLWREIILKPEIHIYIESFGKQDDCCVVSELGGKVIGAAWTRIIPAFGHIDDDTPELAVSVLPNHRGRGLGTKLLVRLFELLRERGYQVTSLSVQKENPAFRLYRRLEYEIFSENMGDYIMLKKLQ